MRFNGDAIERRMIGYFASRAAGTRLLLGLREEELRPALPMGFIGENFAGLCLFFCMLRWEDLVPFGLYIVVISFRS